MRLYRRTFLVAQFFQFLLICDLNGAAGEPDHPLTLKTAKHYGNDLLCHPNSDEKTGGHSFWGSEEVGSIIRVCLKCSALPRHNQREMSYSASTDARYVPAAMTTSATKKVTDGISLNISKDNAAPIKGEIA